MHIVNISYSISSLAGGLQSAVREFSSALADLGNRVTLVHGVDPEGEYETSPMTLQHTEIGLAKVGFGKASLLSQMNRALRPLEPDLIIQHGLWDPFVWQITTYCRQARVPYVVVPHGMLDPYILKTRPYRKMVANLLYQRRNIESAIAFRALNQSEFEHIRSHYAGPIVVSPNGFTIRDEMPQRSRRMEQICFLGRIDPKKGVFELVQGWIDAQAAGGLPPEAKLRIAGWTSDRQYEARCHDAARDNPSIEFVGSVFGPAKWGLLCESGAFILPSKGEGLPMAVLEAWAAGSVVIMTEACNFSEEIRRTAAITTGPNPEAISVALAKYFAMGENEKEALVEFGKVAVGQFSWAVSAERFISEIAELGV